MKNKKGFTLVEIIISIAIGSIVLMIAGSMFVSSFKFLFSTTDTDLNKRLVDSLIDVVRSDVEYAYDVRLIDVNNPDNHEIINNELTIENGWHSYYVRNHQLVRDEEDNYLFNEGYYNNKNFALYANGNYEPSTRVDFKFVLSDKDENVYTAKDTIMFLNVVTDKEILANGLYTNGYVSLTEENNKDYRLFFKNKYDQKNPSKPDTSLGDGTVSDLIDNLSFDNSRGYFNSNRIYNQGDYVYYNGYWWLKNSSNSSNSKPGESGSIWERVDAYYRVGENSSYLQGDIVIYNNKYYKCVTNDYAWTNPELCSKPPVSNEDNQYNYQWVIISAEEAKEKKYNKPYSYSENMVVKRYLPSDIKVSDINPSSVPLYDNSKVYNVGDIVKIELDNTGYYLKYYKAFKSNTSGLRPGVLPEYGWVLIENDYNSNSAYLAGDYIIGNNGFTNGGTFGFYVPKYNYVENEENALQILLSIPEGKTYEKPYSQYLKPEGNSSNRINAFWTKINCTW